VPNFSAGHDCRYMAGCVWQRTSKAESVPVTLQNKRLGNLIREYAVNIFDIKSQCFQLGKQVIPFLHIVWQRYQVAFLWDMSPTALALSATAVLLPRPAKCNGGRCVRCAQSQQHPGTQEKDVSRHVADMAGLRNNCNAPGHLNADETMKGKR